MGYQDVRFDSSTTFLVTGGAGFIGSNICGALLRMGLAVRCVDNLSTGKMENINELMGNSGFSFILGDICDSATAFSLTSGVDFVLHQAAWGSVPKSIKQPLDYEEINIKGTLSVMEASRFNKVKKFIYASSSSVYGDEANLPKKEGREGSLLSPYAITKKTNEEYGKLYSSIYGLETYGLRYFNVFGKKQNPNGEYAAVIPRFISCFIKDERPTIYGDGNQTRDFTYVENVIEANLKACLAPSHNAGRVFNIAYGAQERLIDIFYKLRKLMGKEHIEPLFEQGRAGDIKHSFADISNASEAFGYDPSWTFSMGINDVISWYKSNL